MTDGNDELDLDARPLARRKAEIFARKRRENAPEARNLKRIGGPADEPADAPAGDEKPAPAAEAPAAPRAKSAPADVAMVDVGAKPVIARAATAEGFLRLQAGTVSAIREGRVKKGDPFPVAQTAAIMAAKNTPDVLPLCHPIPLTGVDVHFTLAPEGVRVEVTVRADYKTGVEMEALTAVTVALLTVWDMTKYLEKDAAGQYPATRLDGVRVLDKRKGAPP